ncbi:MAG: NADH-quinone oxidoreductase subunit NuoH [Bacteroidota bacterium]|nr:NADH-quinone oxidoreductase subunit NuoH [Bacteroidota bacterium]
MPWIPVIYLVFILITVLIVFYAERKIASFIQDRLGPTHVGKWGILQPVADLIKLFQKEDIVPSAADPFLFKIAPYLILASVFTGFAVVPLCNGLKGASISTGVFFMMAIVSLDIIGLLIAGWASNNKYALFGSMRSVAQIISYEIPLGFSVLSVIMITETLDLSEISVFQSNSSNTFVSGGFLSWNVIKAPHLFIAWIIFFISSLAECNRAPFDIPEAESELVAGFHVEYSGFRFAIFFLAEYALMILVSIVGAIIFFGGWNSPLPNIGNISLFDWTNGIPGTFSGYLLSGFWLVLKAMIFLLIQIWIRWTFPRVRIDQLMYIGWKVLTPASLLLIFISAVWKLWVMG